MDNRNVRSKLSKAIAAYYSGKQDSPDFIDDETYEELVAESGLSENEIEDLKKDSIVVLDKIKHHWPMTTLPKIHSLEELEEDDNEVGIWQLKFDGCSIEVHYDSNGKFDCASTRGNYTYGDNRTALVKKLMQLERIPEFTGLKNASIRGELLVSDEDWRTISTLYKNQRNAASGIANRDDLSYASCLTFIPYDVVDDATGRKDLWLSESSAKLYNTYEQAEEAAKNAGVPIDGLVYKRYKSDSLKDQTYAVAYKFSDQTFKTRILDVRWHVGKTGRLTPIAEFDTVFIDADVSKASLGSYDNFKKFDFHYNDEIEVRKANDIIPQVVANLGNGTDQKIEPPMYWNGGLTRVEGKHLFTKNETRWKDVLWSQIQNLAGKGIGYNFMEKCIEEYGVTEFCELCNVVRSKDFKLYRFKEKSTENARKAIEEASNADLIRFLAAFGYDALGWKTCEKIVDKLVLEANAHNEDPTLHLLQLQSPYEFVYAISGIGDVAASSFEKNYNSICEVLEDWNKTFGHLPKAIKQEAISGPEIVVTGTFNGFKRKEVEDEFVKNGFRPVGRVTSNTKFLIAGNGGGSKRSIAQSLNVSIIETEGDLNKALNILKDEEK